MARVLHVIDRNTRLDMLDQLAMLSGPEDRIVSIGPAPQAEDRLAIAPTHRPLGSASLCALRMRSIARDVDVIHAWSDVAHRVGEIVTRSRPRALICSLPTTPASRPSGILLRATHRGQTVWTVPTDSAKGRLAQSGVPVERIFVLPPAALPPDNAQQRRQRFRRELGIGDDQFIIVAPGEMIRPGGHKVAAWVHAMLKYVTSNVHLFMPDSGPLERTVLAFADGAGFIDDIFGPWPPSRRADALAASDAALLCHSRNCGTAAVAHSMAAGLPVVTFATGDLVESGGDAILHTAASAPRGAAQAVLRLIEEPDLAADLAERGRQRAAARFDPATIRAHLADIYADAADRPLEEPGRSRI
ncbi:MAG: glycosyltransferase [Planctomycetota bacterium]|jgi:glycosyltransferase involved in cell wall biosynthesis